MRSLEPGCHAVVVGATGGIGAALVAALAGDPTICSVMALARHPERVMVGGTGVRAGRLDLEDEPSIRAAFNGLESAPRLVIVATGLLHDGAMQPEKSVRSLDAEAMMRSYRINCVGPALVAKHALPLMPRNGRTVFAALGARVGSIGDNRSGGWHAYRAAKAALAMTIRTLSIETARRSPDQLCVGLHPGTVATGLSAPFQRGVAEGGLFTPEFAAERLLAVIDALTPDDHGRVLAWDGQVVPP